MRAARTLTGDATGRAAGRAGPERRAAARVLVCEAAQLVADTAHGSMWRTGRVIDVSATGCAILLHAPLEPGTFVRVELPIDGRRLPVSGRVVRCDVGTRGWTTGVGFDGLTPAKRDALARYVADRLRRRLV